jgi:D-ribose pyranose/furanose isomerase RbsD
LRRESKRIRDGTVDEELELLKDICSRLDNADIDYMVTGSIAMALCAVPRMTRDIDIILDVNVSDIEKIINLFEKDSYINETAVKEAVQNRTMFNIIHNDTVIKVDLIIMKDFEYLIEEFSYKLMIFLPLKVFSKIPKDCIKSTQQNPIQKPYVCKLKKFASSLLA